MSLPESLSDASITKALRKKGYKATTQRIAICGLALSSREHRTAREIYREVKTLHPTVSLATVYNTLQVLRELNLVQELAFPQGESKFDSNLTPHVNVVCLRCGTVRDVNDRAVQDVVARVASRTRFAVAKQRFDIYGTCEKCARRTKANP
jgi:Fur family peroxide stress response transcriptional regulator